MNAEDMEMQALKILLDYPDGLYRAKWHVPEAIKSHLIKSKLVRARGVGPGEEVCLTKEGMKRAKAG